MPDDNKTKDNKADDSKTGYRQDPTTETIQSRAAREFITEPLHKLGPISLIRDTAFLPLALAKFSFGFIRRTVQAIPRWPGRVTLSHTVDTTDMLKRGWFVVLLPFFGLLNFKPSSFLWWFEFIGLCTPIATIVFGTALVNVLVSKQADTVKTTHVPDKRTPL